jgi:hypothetical protein
MRQFSVLLDPLHLNTSCQGPRIQRAVWLLFLKTGLQMSATYFVHFYKVLLVRRTA